MKGRPDVSFEELDVLEAYLHGDDVNHQAFYKERQILDLNYPSQIEIAAAQIVLEAIQGQLPQSLCTDERGSITFGRYANCRPTTSQEEDFLTLKPELLFCVNWVDAAPGFCRPEAYYVTHIPGLDQYIVTASRDSSDLFGCTDHALGFAPASRPRLEACRAIIVEYWQKQFASGERWVRLFEEGVVGIALAERWAEDVRWEKTT